MKGLKLAEEFYLEYGQTLIQEQFSQYEGRIAVGLVGQGSECFGFDDEISHDHDFGPGFCMWLTDEDYDIIGEHMQKAYFQLPTEFLGYRRLVSLQGGDRVGTFRISEFYNRFIGSINALSDPINWLRIPEHYWATVTNGQVFRDDLGQFSKIRSKLLDYYPEDIRIKKIAAKAALIAQSGQYNYNRMMQRGESVGARLAIGEFIQNAIAMTYLLNKKYMPFYKWMHRGMENFERLSEVRSLLSDLVLLPCQQLEFQGINGTTRTSRLNTDDRIIVIVESICDVIIKELMVQGLTEIHDSFLLNHTSNIMSHINDKRIRNLHVMIG